jgi:hypothetical protein
VIGATNKELLKSTSLAYLEARMGDKCPSGYALTTQWCSDWNIEFRWYNDTQIDIEMPDDLKF